MPTQLRMNYQTKNINSNQTIKTREENNLQLSINNPRYGLGGNKKGTASLSGLVGRIAKLPKGCKSCGH